MESAALDAENAKGGLIRQVMLVKSGKRLYNGCKVMKGYESIAEL